MAKPLAHQARKRFGQNFLEDDQIIQRIVRSISPKAGEQLLEIGPGRGALTEPLLAASGGQLQALELDRDLIPILRTRLFRYPDLVIHEGDALNFNFTSLVNAPGKLRVVGNLPYNISTPLIFHLLAQSDIIEDMHFMLQQEVVDRLAADVGSKNYGRLGVMVQYRCAVTPLFSVPPSAFQPQPKVMSAVVRLKPHAKLPVTANNPKLLERVVKAAFSQRRKTLRNNFKGLIDPGILSDLEIDPNLRAEQLSLQKFVTISNALDDSELDNQFSS